MDCPSCGGANPDGKKFCGDCGAPLALVCPACGSANPPEKKFCGDCGTSLTADKPPPAPQEPKPAAPQAERRQLTVMFCDLVGSTELAARLDPEDMREVIRAYQNAVAGEIARFEGHVAKFMGDGVLAYFGWPRAHEDEAERAVRGGLAVVEAIKSLATPHGESLAVRVGIATGLVVVGDLVGEGAAQEEAVTGETPNLAARLQDLAPPNGIVVAQSTQRLLGGLFELGDLGVQHLKGFAQPVHAWQVVAESTAEGRFEALRGLRLTPLVGREHELGLLMERFERAREGEGQVVLLSGEPGIGKSRIVRALRERLESAPHTPLTHYCSPHHVNSALYPVVGLLERAAGFERGDGPDVRLAKLEALLALGTDRLDEAVPLVAALLGMPVDEKYPSLNLTPQRQKQRALEVLVDQVAGLAAEKPVLAMYEDVHWIDPTTLEALDLLIARVQRLPVLVLITYRPEFSPPWGSHAHVMQLSLTRLTRGHGAAIVERTTGGKALPAEVLEQILARTDGVPLFVEELTKTVLESGLLRDAGDRYELAGPLAPLAIPATLHDSLMARLDNLAPVKEVAQIGAVIGREFGHDLLAAVAPLPEAELTAALDQLVAAELIFRRGTPPQATYSFKHALVQDAAYQSLLKSRRQQLHARITEALERDFLTVVDQQPELLAHHCTKAGMVEKAAVYWHTAGQRALERSATAEAVAQLTKGLEVLQSLPGSPERVRHELGLQVLLGQALIAAKGLGASETGQAYLRARELCEQVGDAPQVFPALQGQYVYYSERGELGAAQEIAQTLLRLAREQGNAAAEVVGHRTVGAVSFHLGKLPAARAHLEEGLSRYDAACNVTSRFVYALDSRAVCLNFLSLVLVALGHPDQARARSRDALAHARTLAHLPTIADSLFLACVLHQVLGDWLGAQTHAEALVALATEHGFQLWLAEGLVLRGWTLVDGGHVGEGLSEIRRALSVHQSAGGDVFSPYFLALLADAYGRNDQAASGLDVLADALDRVDRTEGYWFEAELHRLRGELLLLPPDPDRLAAEACFRQALAIARGQDAKMWELRAATSLGRLWRGQGQQAEAHDLLAPVYDWFTEGLDTADLEDAKQLLDALH